MYALSALPVAQKLAFTLNRFFNIFAYTVSGLILPNQFRMFEDML